MTKEILIKFINKGYSSYQISKELGLSQSVVYRQIKKLGLNTQTMTIKKSERFCLTCKNKLKGKQIMFCSRFCNNHIDGHNKKVYDAAKKLRQEKRIKLINLHGSKCEICGYDKNYAVLSFHHKNPKEKSFTIGGCSHHSWEKLVEESKKCSLLCSNCHMELHHPKWNTNIVKDYHETFPEGLS